MAYANVKHLADDYNQIMDQLGDVLDGAPAGIRKDIETLFSDIRVLERIKTPVVVEEENGRVCMVVWSGEHNYVHLEFEGDKRVRCRYALHTPEKPATGNGTLLLLPGHRMVIANLLTAMYSWDGKS